MYSTTISFQCAFNRMLSWLTKQNYKKKYVFVCRAYIYIYFSYFVIFMSIEHNLNKWKFMCVERYLDC